MICARSLERIREVERQALFIGPSPSYDYASKQTCLCRRSITEDDALAMFATTASYIVNKWIPAGMIVSNIRLDQHGTINSQSLAYDVDEWPL